MDLFGHDFATRAIGDEPGIGAAAFQRGGFDHRRGSHEGQAFGEGSGYKEDLDSLWRPYHAAQAVGLGEREQGSLEDRPDGLGERHAKGVT